MRFLVQALISAVVGFFAMYTVLSMRDKGDISWPTTEIIIIALIISFISLLITVVGTLQITASTKKKVEGDEEDEYEKWVYKKYSDTTLASIISSTLSLFTASVGIISNVHVTLMILPFVLIVFNFALQPFTYNALCKVYSYRAFPAWTDKKYAEKILALTDEGERHVMFEGLQKAYSSINVLLPLAIILLMFYSSFSGQSQFFSILILTIILIYVNTRYILAIRSS